MESVVEHIVVGQIKRFIPSEKGGWYLVWSDQGRFRADAIQFATPPGIGSIISFLPGDSTRSGAPRRIQQILF